MISRPRAIWSLPTIGDVVLGLQATMQAWQPTQASTSTPCPSDSPGYCWGG